MVAFVLGGLLFQRGAAGQDPRTGVDVEELFASVQLLATRHTLGAAPFIAAWHARVDELDRIKSSANYKVNEVTTKIYQTIAEELERNVPSFSSYELDRAFAQSAQGRTAAPGKAIEEFMKRFVKEWLCRAKGARPRGAAGLDRAFSAAVQSAQPQPGEGSIFDTAAHVMIQTLKGLVWLDDANRVSYLAPLLRRAELQGRLCVATLNYDNSVELLASSQHASWSTGIEAWAESGILGETAEGIAS